MQEVGGAQLHGLQNPGAPYTPMTRVKEKQTSSGTDYAVQSIAIWGF